MGAHLRFDTKLLPEAILSGTGSRASLAAEADALGLSRLLIVASPSLRRHALFAELIGTLGDRVAKILDAVVANNPDAAVDAAVTFARESRIDAVVGIGGGATLDLAKAIAMISASGGTILEHVTRFEPPATLVPPAFDVRPLPWLALPSTLSAAEMIPGGVVTETATGRKRLFFHPGLAAKRVFLDGALVAPTPRAVLAQSGLNALHHCVEALYSLGAQPISDAFALKALAELFAVLPSFAPGREPPEPSVFQRAIEGSGLSGLTYANSSLGIGHALCHALAARFGAAHAAANAVILPLSLRFNLEAAGEPLAAAGRAIGEPSAERFVARVDALCAKLETPRRLRDLGLARWDARVLAEEACTDWLVSTNPRPVVARELAGFLESAW